MMWPRIFPGSAPGSNPQEQEDVMGWFAYLENNLNSAQLNSTQLSTFLISSLFLHQPSPFTRISPKSLSVAIHLHPHRLARIKHFRLRSERRIGWHDRWNFQYRSVRSSWRRRTKTNMMAKKRMTRLGFEPRFAGILRVHAKYQTSWRPCWDQRFHVIPGCDLPC